MIIRKNATKKIHKMLFWLIITGIAVTVAVFVWSGQNKGSSGLSAKDAGSKKQGALSDAQYESLQESLVAYDGKNIAAAGAYVDTKTFEDGDILSVVERDSTDAEEKVYDISMWMVRSSFFCLNEKVYTQEQVSRPVLITAKENAEGLEVLNVQYPEEGSLYASSVAELFPEKIAEQLQTFQTDQVEAIAALEKQNIADAESFFGYEYSDEQIDLAAAVKKAGILIRTTQESDLTTYLAAYAKGKSTITPESRVTLDTAGVCEIPDNWKTFVKAVKKEQAAAILIEQKQEAKSTSYRYVYYTGTQFYLLEETIDGAGKTTVTTTGTYAFLRYEKKAGRVNYYLSNQKDLDLEGLKNGDNGYQLLSF